MIWADRVAVVWAGLWLLLASTFTSATDYGAVWFCGALGVWLLLRGLDWVGTGVFWRGSH